MLLFIAAPSLIIQDIKAHTKVTIQTNAQEAVAPDPRPLDRATKKDFTIREETLSLSDKEYAEVSVEAEGIFRIMLVADGQPEADLDKMRDDGESRGILDGFYSPERENMILEAKDEANHCSKGTSTYVMTTAFGAKPVQSSIRLYDVPGEKAIRRNIYLNRYKRSLLEILPQGERIEKVVLVYYASVSRKPFRNKIFSILKNLARDPHLRTKYDIHVCMYGHSRAHPNERWRDLCAVFDGLTGGDAEILRDLKNRWTDHGMDEYRFFIWF